MPGRRIRIAGALIAGFLSLPVLVAVWAGSFTLYWLARFGGYRGDPLQALAALLSSWQGIALVIAAILLVAHLMIFAFLLVRFARRGPLPRWALIYCLSVAIAVLGERVRLLLAGDDAFMWFGLLSLPHLLCLLALGWTGSHGAPAARA